MPEMLPRFNQNYIKNLPQECIERDFVNTVGDITYLLRTNINVVDSTLRHPFMFGEYKTQEEVDSRYASFADDAEKLLDENGLHELVVALNGLNVITRQLHGQEFSWVTSTFKRDAEPEYDSAYLIGSKIGFLFEIGYSPALLLQMAENSYDTNGTYMQLHDLFDLRIFPK